MDVDRRYYNQNTGAVVRRLREHQPAARLPAADRRAGARLRPLPAHRLRPLPRRAPAGVRHARSSEQVAQSFSLIELPKLVNAITKQHRGRRGRHELQGSTVLQYALFAYGAAERARVPGQDRRTCSPRHRLLTTSSPTSRRPSSQFANPDVESSKAANAAALGSKLKTKTPPPSTGDGHRAERQRRRRAPRRTRRTCSPSAATRSLLPPNSLQAERAAARLLPHEDLLRPGAARAEGARRSRSQKLIEPADVLPKLPRAQPEAARARPGLDARWSSSARRSTARSRRRPLHDVPTHQPPSSAPTRRGGRRCSSRSSSKVPFKLEAPTVLERELVPRHAPGDSRCASTGSTRASTRRSGSSSGPAATSTGGSRRRTGTTRRRLADRASGTTSAAASSTSTTRARTCTWSCCARTARRYWVVNTLLDSLSNETMLAIAKGLKPLTAGQVESRAMAEDGHLRRRLGRPRHGRLLRRARPRGRHPRRRCPRRSTRCARGEVPFHEARRAGAARAEPRAADASRSTSTTSPTASSSSSASTRRRPTRATPTSRASGPWSTSCPSCRADRCS